MNDIKMKVAQNLKYYRELNKLTQKQVAEELGVKHNAVSSWESGTNSIDMVVLDKICELFKISLDTIYGRASTNVGLLPNRMPLTADIKELIECYQSCNTEDKEELLMLARHKVKKNKADESEYA